jgi:hypothetical protein
MHTHTHTHTLSLLNTLNSRVFITPLFTTLSFFLAFPYWSLFLETIMHSYVLNDVLFFNLNTNTVGSNWKVVESSRDYCSQKGAFVCIWFWWRETFRTTLTLLLWFRSQIFKLFRQNFLLECRVCWFLRLNLLPVVTVCVCGFDLRTILKTL